MLGYALLGAGWLVFKTEGALRDWAYARIPWLVAAVFVVLGLAFVVSLTIDAGAIAQSNLRLAQLGAGLPDRSALPRLSACSPARGRGATPFPSR